MSIATPHPKPRCRFGRPHFWMFGFYHQGVLIGDDWVKCGECGQIESDA